MDEFQRCQQKMKNLIRQKILPINMERKLKYLQSLILNKHNQSIFVDLLPDFERLSLLQMNKDTQKVFFINIINCFSPSWEGQRQNGQSQQQDERSNLNNLIDQQMEHLKSLKTKIQDQFLNEDKFKLVSNITNGKIEVNQVNNSVRMLLFIEHCQIREYIESYLMFDCWNTQVQTFKILKQIRKNTYLAFIKLKKYNLWTSQRYSYVTISFLKECDCFTVNKRQAPNKRNESKYHILIKSVEYDQLAQQGAVKMSFNQVISFSQIKDRDNKIFISLISDVDYKAYQFLAKKCQININLLKDVPSITILYKQRMIQQNKVKYIQFDHCGCTIQKQYSCINLSLLEEKSNIHEQIILSQSNQVFYQENEVIQVIKDEVNDIKNQKIIQIMKKKIYQSYYLKLRFKLDGNETPYIQSNYSLNQDRNFLLQNGRWLISKNEEYIFIDENQLKNQKGVLKLIIKQITSNILAGKSIMTMSLPVEIFDRKSTLQGIVDILGFVPKYMHDATNTADVIEQIKNVAAGFIFLFACHPKVCKPFNPILGETYQAQIGGIPIFVEQISHHPPISAFYMRNEKFEAYGNFDLHVDLGLNAAYSKIYGVFHVKIFATNTQFVIKYPELEMGGIMYGNRQLKLKGKGYVLQKSNSIYLEYSIGKDKKKVYQYDNKLKNSDLAGGIFKVTKQFVSKLMNQDRKKSTQGIRYQETVEKYCQISGKWYGNLCFDNKIYKSIESGAYPITPQRPTALLPSDMLFREDIIYKKWGDNKKSNQQKQMLENLQRRDRKLREKFSK